MKLPREIEEAFKEFGLWHDELNDVDCLKLYASIGLSVLKQASEAWTHSVVDTNMWQTVKRIERELQEVLDGD